MDTPNRIETDEDFINNKRYGDSLKALLEKYPSGCPDHIAAKSLNMTKAQLDERYQEIVACLKGKMGV